MLFCDHRIPFWKIKQQLEARYHPSLRGVGKRAADELPVGEVSATKRRGGLVLFVIHFSTFLETPRGDCTFSHAASPLVPRAITSGGDPLLSGLSANSMSRWASCIWNCSKSLPGPGNLIARGQCDCLADMHCPSCAAHLLTIPSTSRRSWLGNPHLYIQPYHGGEYGVVGFEPNSGWLVVFIASSSRFISENWMVPLPLTL